jgi:hypothetical protein
MVVSNCVIPGKRAATQIELTNKFIALALDSGKIELFSRESGLEERRTLEGHTGGIWALSSWEDIVCFFCHLSPLTP